MSILHCRSCIVGPALYLPLFPSPCTRSSPSPFCYFGFSPIASFRSSCPPTWSSPMPSSSRQADWSSPRSSSKNYGESMLRLIWACGRPIQNEENIAVPSPQASAVFSNPKYRASPVQISEQNNARGNRYSDVNSPALKISRPRPRITNWKRADLIAKGSFASVYRGYSNEDGIFFAAKGVSLTEPNHLPHLENEIAILKLLDDHENIIQFYGEDRGGPEMHYIFLELASQGTLEQAYKNFCFNESQVSDYTRQILQGLKYLHSCNVVHGDLKCANILVTESGRIKLADFGLSKRMEDHSYGFPSDICSLGCTVLEMSTGEYPQCNDKEVISVELAIRSGRGIIVPRNLPRNLRDFISKCLADTNKRPTAADLLAHPFVKESSSHADS